MELCFSAPRKISSPMDFSLVVWYSEEHFIKCLTCQKTPHFQSSGDSYPIKDRLALSLEDLRLAEVL